jgi:2'-5' RNA ligase
MKEETRTIRSFFAIPLREPEAKQVAAIQAELQKTISGVRWESSSKYHLTVKFLGNTLPQKLEQLVDQLPNPISTIPTHQLTFDSIGVFPSFHNPRVVWIGGETPDSLKRLYTLIEDVSLLCGFPKEDHPFRSHVTIGRIKDPKLATNLIECIKKLTLQPILFNVDCVVLMKSELSSAGSEYTVLHSFPLISK